MAGGVAPPGVRSDEATGIAPLYPDGFALSFHHTNGRSYEPNEQLGVALKNGDWLEYEVVLSGNIQPELVDGHGRVLPATIVRTARGLRVAADSPVLAAKLRLRST